MSSNECIIAIIRVDNLDVSMRDAVVVQIFQPLQDLTRAVHDLRLLEWTAALVVLSQAAAVSEFQQYAHLIC